MHLLETFPVQAIRTFIANPTQQNLYKVSWDSCWGLMCRNCPFHINGVESICPVDAKENMMACWDLAMRNQHLNLAEVVVMMIQVLARYEEFAGG